MVERTIAGAGVALATTDDGEGIPVVLLHGLTASRRYVVMGSRALQRSGHRVIAYDARVHGSSSPAPAHDAYGYGDLGADLLAVLDRGQRGARAGDRVLVHARKPRRRTGSHSPLVP